MGGEGSMSAMRTSLKNNNSLLKKKSRSFFDRSTNRLKSKYKQHLKNYPKLSEDELLIFRKKLKQEKRINDIKQILILLILITAMIIGLIYLL